MISADCSSLWHLLWQIVLLGGRDSVPAVLTKQKLCLKRWLGLLGRQATLASLRDENLRICKLLLRRYFRYDISIIVVL